MRRTFCEGKRILYLEKIRLRRKKYFLYAIEREDGQIEICLVCSCDIFSEEKNVRVLLRLKNAENFKMLWDGTEYLYIHQKKQLKCFRVNVSENGKYIFLSKVKETSHPFEEISYLFMDQDECVNIYVEREKCFFKVIEDQNLFCGMVKDRETFFAQIYFKRLELKQKRIALSSDSISKIVQLDLEIIEEWEIQDMIMINGIMGFVYENAIVFEKNGEYVGFIRLKRSQKIIYVSVEGGNLEIASITNQKNQCMITEITGPELYKVVQVSYKYAIQLKEKRKQIFYLVYFLSNGNTDVLLKLIEIVRKNEPNDILQKLSMIKAKNLLEYDVLTELHS